MSTLEETLYTIKPTSRFKKDLKRVEKQGLNLSLLKLIIKDLANEVSLNPSLRDHELSGDYVGCRECHIAPDWLLVYEVDEDFLYVYLIRTGSHSELF